MRKKYLCCLFLFCISCTTTYKVETTTHNLPDFNIQTSFKDVRLKPVKFKECDNNNICLSTQDASNLAFNIQTLQEHIKYIKSIYTCDIQAYKDIVNNKK